MRQLSPGSAGALSLANSKECGMTQARDFTPRSIQNAYLRLQGLLARRNQRTDLMQQYDIDLVFDVGANEGQYARRLMKHGYAGRIVSFEPLPDAYQKLSSNCLAFANWQAEPYALGSNDIRATLHVAGNSQSSSLQSMHDNHVAAAPQSAYVGQCEVAVRKLDTVFEQFYRPGDRCGLKIDVQGHEHQVLEGAADSLKAIQVVELELSMVTLYDDQILWRETIDLMSSLGFCLATLAPGFRDPRTGFMLQADGVFIRESAVEGFRESA